MIKSKLYKNINIVFFVIYVITCVIFPSDFYNLKKISFILLIIGNLGYIVWSLKKKNIFELWIYIFFPLSVILFTTLTSQDVIGNILGSYCMFSMLLIIVIDRYNIDFLEMLLFSLKILCCFYLFLFLADIFSIFSINDSIIRDFIYENNMGMIGKHASYTFYYKIFLKTSPLLVILYFHSLDKKNTFWSILSFICVILSGTRANVILIILSSVLWFLSFYSGKGILLSLSIGSVLIIKSQAIYSAFINILNSSELSNLTREGHLKSFINLYETATLDKVLMGYGFTTEFYSFGTNSYITSFEWSYLDLFRKIGCINFLGFLLFLLAPIRKLLINKWMLYSYITYLIIAATNPLLFNSTSYLLYILIYQYFFRKNKNTVPSNYID